MHQSMRTSLLLVIILIALFCIYRNNREAFTSRREKARAIIDWFGLNSQPTYTQYKKEMAGSNIVEYEDALKLFQDKNLTIETLEKTL